MLSPRFTFIVFLIALWCAALKKAQACTYPNLYTNLASKFELPLSRRTLSPLALLEKCKRQCQDERLQNVDLNMQECIQHCVNDENGPSPISPDQTGEPKEEAPHPDSVEGRCDKWCAFCKKRKREKILQGCKGACHNNPLMIEVDEVALQQDEVSLSDVQQPMRFIKWCIDTCGRFMTKPSNCMRRCFPRTDLRDKWKEQERIEGDAGPELSANAATESLEKMRGTHSDKRPLLQCMQDYINKLLLDTSSVPKRTQPSTDGNSQPLKKLQAKPPGDASGLSHRK